MATTPSIHYPTRDGRPMAETPVHGDAMIHLDQVLRRWFADEPNVYIGRNMMLYYEEGDPRKHVSPDVFLTIGVAKEPQRDAYFTWLEGGRAPDLVVEITSKSTRKEDEVKKYALYQGVLHVKEYFLFDPRGEYIKPRLKGYRLQGEQYLPIDEIAGRLPSQVLGLDFAADGQMLQLYDPATDARLLTEEEAQREGWLRERELRLKAEQEVELLRQRLKELERPAGNGTQGE
ncbi:MAG TPA: Uma2 family endonuclease [Pirellulales bacterium]|nr:Uma2 family endonuclease [Pirellulales bacterium]